MTQLSLENYAESQKILEKCQKFVAIKWRKARKYWMKQEKQAKGFEILILLNEFFELKSSWEIWTEEKSVSKFFQTFPNFNELFPKIAS